jgi:hypothetical protein
MSDFVVHFTRGGEGEDDSRNMFSIYWDHVLKPKKAFGVGKEVCPVPESQFAVCFSEIPPGDWARLKERRQTKYGIGFSKSFLISNGAGPIWYVWKVSPLWGVLKDMMRREASNPGADIWKLTPLIDAPGKYGSREYFFEWEREWRHVGEFAFKPEDVAFLLIPEEFHEDARTFFKGHRDEHTGPPYLCPYVDPTWDGDRILETLREEQR